MKTEEFEKKIKNGRYIKIILKNKMVIYEKANTIKLHEANKDSYNSTGDYMAIDKHGVYKAHTPLPNGYWELKLIKGIVPVTEKEWKKIKLLCII